jgi:hypothetical protein
MLRGKDRAAGLYRLGLTYIFLFFIFILTCAQFTFFARTKVQMLTPESSVACLPSAFVLLY